MRLTSGVRQGYVRANGPVEAVALTQRNGALTCDNGVAEVVCVRGVRGTSQVMCSSSFVVTQNEHQACNRDVRGDALTSLTWERRVMERGKVNEMDDERADAR